MHRILTTAVGSLAVLVLAAAPSMAALNISIGKFPTPTITLDETNEVNSPNILTAPIPSSFSLTFAGLAGTTSGTVLFDSPIRFISVNPTTFESNTKDFGSLQVTTDGMDTTLTFSQTSGFLSPIGAAGDRFSVANFFDTATLSGNLALILGLEVGQFVTESPIFGLTRVTVAAVPEPASMIYGSLLATTAGLGYYRRRRAANQQA